MRFSFLLPCSLLLGLALLLTPGLAVGASAPQHQATAGRFDLDRDNGMPLVEVRFSDSVTGLFAIDTGAYDSVITAACAKRLGYKQDVNPLFQWEVLSGGALTAPAVMHVPNLWIEKLHVSDLTFQIAPSDSLGTHNGRVIDGLIGGTLLSHFALLLDYPRRTLVWIYPGDLNDQAVAGLGLDPGSAIGLHQELGSEMGLKVNHYSAHVLLQSGTQECSEEMYLDTGAPLSSISAEAARRLRLTPSGTEPYRFVFQAPDLAKKAAVPVFRVGPQSLSDVVVIYPSHRDARMVSLIGANVLGGCLALLDFGPHRFYLKPVLPGLSPGTPPALDSRRVDWERLRNAPDLPSFPDLIRAILTPETLEGLPTRVARLRASMTGGAGDAEKFEQIGALLRRSGDKDGSRAANDRAVALRRADAEAQPGDGARAVQWAEALILLGDDEQALAVAQKGAAHWPELPIVWRALGRAQENRAACLLLGEWGKPVADSQALDPFPDVGLLPDRPDPARVQQIEALRRQARDSYGRSVALAPQDAEGYHSRARFWILDGWLLTLLRDLEVKGQSFSTASALAGALSDYQNEARLRPDDVPVLRRAVLLDAALPVFHDGDWLREHLHTTGQGLGMKSDGLTTAKAAQAHLLALSGSADKGVAASALEALGEVQAARRDPQAEATLRRALALDPARPGVLAALAAHLVADGRLGDLRDLLTRQIVKDDTPPARLLLSVTLAALGQTGAAEEQARVALKGQPDSPTACLTLAGLLLARSGYDAQVLPEVSACLTKVEEGLSGHAAPEQMASLQTMRAVWLALTSDPTGARQQLIRLAHDQPTCTQAREALSAMAVPPAAP